MKLQVEIELDWIEEGGTIDEEVKDSIILGVHNSISAKCMSEMKDKSKAAFDEAVSGASALIGAKAIEFAEDWLENEVTITDKWGDDSETISIKGLIKRNFDNLLERKVDAKGQFSDNYNGKYKLIEFLTNKRVELEVEARMKDYGKDIDARIKAAIDKSIHDNVSDRFAQMVVGAAKQDYLDIKAKAITED